MPAVVMAGLVACSGQQGAESTTIPTQPTTTNATVATTMTTTVAPTTTKTTLLVGEELLACMVGGWRLDVTDYERELQAREDPSERDIMIDVESGSGALVIEADRTFTLSYDELTIRFHFSGMEIPDTMLVVSGEVTAVFDLDGNVFIAGDVDDPVLDIRSGDEGNELRELPPVLRYAALRLGTRANHPYYMETITVECRGDRLVIDDVIVEDQLTGDGPSTIWIRDPNG